MRLALAALEACLRDERWVGMRGEAMKKKGEGEDAPTAIPAYGRWAPLASQMSGGKGKGG
jgi:hypothetical protein